MTTEDDRPAARAGAEAHRVRIFIRRQPQAAPAPLVDFPGGLTPPAAGACWLPVIEDFA